MESTRIFPTAVRRRHARVIVLAAVLHSLISSSPVPPFSCHALQATSSTATRGGGVQTDTNQARRRQRHPQQRVRRARRRWRVQQFERPPTAGDLQSTVRTCSKGM